jgi:hypothetical protein
MVGLRLMLAGNFGGRDFLEVRDFAGTMFIHLQYHAIFSFLRFGLRIWCYLQISMKVSAAIAVLSRNHFDLPMFQVEESALFSLLEGSTLRQG